MKKQIAAIFLSASAATLHAGDVMDFPMDSPIYEIAIQEVKDGNIEEWASTRAPLLEMLGAQNGNEKDWTFASFFTLPEPGPLPVYVGMTRWSSMTDFGAAGETVLPSSEWAEFLETINMLAFVQVTPADGEAFILEDYINKSGQVLEVAVRKPAAGMEGEFQAKRDAFFGEVAKEEGYIFDEEFISAEGDKVVLIGWETVDDFQAALGSLSQKEEMGAFFGIIEPKAYQATVLE